jgi:phage gp46-like protein
LTDVRLYQTPDGGEVTITAGSVELDDGITTAIYLSLFGGNEGDSGSDGDKSKQWWGNVEEPDAAKRYRSELQNLLLTIPATSGNLKRIEDAAGRDLAWMVQSKLATGAVAIARLTATKTVSIELSVEIDGRAFPINMTAPWPGAS